MIKYKLAMKQVQTIKDVFCDCCGKSCIDSCGMNYEHSYLSASWGYGSRKDDTSWGYYFCEECSDKIKKMFVRDDD
uniref:Uncharacterized protein n=1 Tax=viral metagenome TaxID=1070528 RepID=A0A6M3LII4_9ZZZZ